MILLLFWAYFVVYTKKLCWRFLICPWTVENSELKVRLWKSVFFLFLLLLWNPLVWQIEVTWCHYATQTDFQRFLQPMICQEILWFIWGKPCFLDSKICYFPHSSSPAKAATALINWCRVILQTTSKSLTDVEINSLTAILCLLSSRIFSTEYKKVVGKAYRELSKICKEFPVLVEKSLERVTSAEKYQVNVLIYSCFLAKKIWWLRYSILYQNIAGREGTFKILFA